MFEHWKAYKNRQLDTKEVFAATNTRQASRAESFASIVSVISQRMAHTKNRDTYSTVKLNLARPRGLKNH